MKIDRYIVQRAVAQSAVGPTGILLFGQRVQSSAVHGDQLVLSWIWISATSNPPYSFYGDRPDASTAPQKLTVQNFSNDMG